jgi:hypothetical protein
MLFDPKWEVRADVFSIESLVSWLEKQPANKAYCYYDHDGCLLHKYFSAVGLNPVWIGGLTFQTKDFPNVYQPIPEFMQDISAEEPHTFGGALARAREADQRISK